MLTWGIPSYTPPYPGYGASPALVPNVSVSVILLMSVLVLLRNAVAKTQDNRLPPEETDYPEDEQTTGFTQVGRVKLPHLLSLMIPCALLVIGIEFIGYIPTACLFMIAIQYVIGSRKTVQMFIVSIAAVAVLYMTMRFGIGVPIPGPQLF